MSELARIRLRRRAYLTNNHMCRAIQRLTIGLIRLYQRTLSRLLPATCRYRPSCSEYASQAVRTHGVVEGLWLGLWRILRCHRFAAGGYDPVPVSGQGLEGKISEQSTEAKLKGI